MLALTGNHGTLHTAAADFLSAAQQQRTLGYDISTHQTVDGEQGRIETRIYWQVEVPDHLPEKAQWRDLRTVGLVQAQREVNGQTTTKIRSSLSRLPVDASRFAQAVRGHWSIENSCHWILDVVFGQDDCRVRTGQAPENLALIRRLALSLLSQERPLKRGIHTKRLMAALDERYLLKILTI